MDSSQHPDRTTMLLSRLHFPVDNIGYGIRAGIWFQGCRVFCRGCLARDTWVFDESTRCGIDVVLDWLAALPVDQVDGITISGGEPTDQPIALRALLDGINAWRVRRKRPVDILLYSGRPTVLLDDRFPWLPASVDVLVTEPFVAAAAGADALRGSANQRVLVGTELGRKRYAAAELEATYADQRHRMGVHVDGDSIRLVGIPLPGDMTRLGAGLSDRGVRPQRTSWLT
ncbi:4Fe-4S cluster-binding domain-containing protein [Nocardia sp. NPDC050175]|uniref:4Fe-4S cluster-binding domain-containing protein n=1 Tax=Nocardia sp. NPDC050175 TaxID=3364317 RepID=UPI0037AE6536